MRGHRRYPTVGMVPTLRGLNNAMAKNLTSSHLDFLTGHKQGKERGGGTRWHRRPKHVLCSPAYREMSESFPLTAKNSASERIVVRVRIDASAPAVPNSVRATYWYTVTDMVMVWLV